MDTRRETFKRFPHKNAADRVHWDLLHPNMLIIVEFYIQFAMEHELEICFTRIFSPKIPGVSISNSHADTGVFTMEDGTKFKWKGRAVDCRVISWSEQMRKRFEKECNGRFNIGAISLSTGEEHEVVYESKTGTAPHFHLQCHP